MAQMGDWPTLYQLVLSAGSKRKPRKALEVPSPPLDPRALDLVEVPTMSVPVDVPVDITSLSLRELLLYIRVRSFQLVCTSLQVFKWGRFEALGSKVSRLTRVQSRVCTHDSRGERVR
jgi:hypothetical protein